MFSQTNQKLELNCLYKTERFTTFWYKQGGGESRTVRHQVFLVLDKLTNYSNGISLYKVLLEDKVMYLSIAAELLDYYLSKVD